MNIIAGILTILISMLTGYYTYLSLKDIRGSIFGKILVWFLEGILFAFGIYILLGK